MQIGILGPFEVRTGDSGFADVPGARLRGLLAALALDPGHVVPKAALIDWIWGERPPSDAVNALQRLVSRLRKALPDGLIEGQAHGYRLAVEPDAVDAVRFERLVVQANADEGPQRVHLLREALGLWRGAAMQDVGLEESAAFDAAVTRLEGLRLTAVEDRFDAEISLGHGGELVTELTDLVAAHPLRERLVAALMRALAAAGRGTEALLVFQRAREILADTLGADPSPGLSALHVALLRGELGQQREDNRKTNLRAELTSFVGKDADVAAVRELIATRRLTTLIGPGGAGKTRLATETARTLLGDLPDGAWLVDLAAIGADGDMRGLDADRARPAGRAARRDTERRPGGRLVTAIREREALLILDNCEHVVAGGGDVRPPGARGVPAAADPGDEQGTARHHRRGAVAGRAAGPAARRRPAAARSSPLRPFSCCGTGRARCARISRRDARARWRRWRASAGRLTGCRWRSNWPRPGCAPCPSISSPAGSTTGSAC